MSLLSSATETRNKGKFETGFDFLPDNPNYLACIYLDFSNISISLILQVLILTHVSSLWVTMMSEKPEQRRISKAIRDCDKALSCLSFTFPSQKVY